MQLLGWVLPQLAACWDAQLCSQAPGLRQPGLVGMGRHAQPKAMVAAAVAAQVAGAPADVITKCTAEVQTTLHRSRPGGRSCGFKGSDCCGSCLHHFKGQGVLLSAV